jgi:hypothetical protein
MDVLAFESLSKCVEWIWVAKTLNNAERAFDFLTVAKAADASPQKAVNTVGLAGMFQMAVPVRHSADEGLLLI